MQDLRTVGKRLIVNQIVEGIWTIGLLADIPTLAQDAAVSNLSIRNRGRRQVAQALRIFVGTFRFGRAEPTIDDSAPERWGSKLLGDTTIVAAQRVAFAMDNLALVPVSIVAHRLFGAEEIDEARPRTMVV